MKIVPKLSSNISATAQNVETMIIGRLLAGIGIGISSAIVPLYISEVPISQILCSIFHLLDFTVHLILFLSPDLTYRNPRGTWICQPAIYMYWDPCSTNSWFAFGRESSVVISPCTIHLLDENNT